MLLSSTQNPKIKQLLALQEKSKERRQTGLFVVEGRRELEHCVAAGYEVESVFKLTVDELTVDSSEKQTSLHSALPSHIAENCQLSTVNCQLSTVNCQLYDVSPHVYERIAYRGSTEGIIAIVRARTRTLDSLAVGGGSSLFVVLESVEKPGNLGAVLRSADAAGASGVIVCDPLTDLYNPNLIRASLGACFTVPTVACTSEEAIRFFKDNHVRILTAQLQDSELYYDTDMTGATALVMGTEATGLTDQWRCAADAHIRIPMLGRMDSLNVSVSTAILLFEAVRQRKGA